MRSFHGRFHVKLSALCSSMTNIILEEKKNEVERRTKLYFMSTVKFSKLRWSLKYRFGEATILINTYLVFNITFHGKTETQYALFFSRSFKGVNITLITEWTY